MTTTKHPGGRPSTGHGPVWEWRKAAGLTQAEAAARLGCSTTSIKNCELEGREPGRYTMAFVKFRELTNVSTLNGMGTT